MTAFDGLREHWEPLAITAPRRRPWRRLCRIVDGVLFVALVVACVALVGALGVIWG